MTDIKTSPDSDLKARHRTMWASGDYPGMVETFLLPLGPRLVEAAGIGAGRRVLDVAAGTGNAAIPAAQRGADAVAWSSMTRDTLDVTAFPEREAFAQHFVERYGPTIAARRNAAANDLEAEFDAALAGVFHAADVGDGAGGSARYALEYLLAVG